MVGVQHDEYKVFFESLIFGWVVITPRVTWIIRVTYHTAWYDNGSKDQWRRINPEALPDHRNQWHWWAWGSITINGNTLNLTISSSSWWAWWSTSSNSTMIYPTIASNSTEEPDHRDRQHWGTWIKLKLRRCRIIARDGKITDYGFDRVYRQNG